MRTPYTELYVHLIWATWDRSPILSQDIEEQVFAAIAVKCRELKCEPLAIGGVEDHVHILVHLHPNMSISNLVKEVKGSSSHLTTHMIQKGEFFKWQGAYRAFTLRKSEVEQVMAYIRNQKAHHIAGGLFADEEISNDDEPPGG